MIAYHDTEWGLPVHDDRRHFEFIVLDAFQAGLSWRTVLHKRAAFEAAFCGFDPVAVAALPDATIEELMLDAGIIRNRLKIHATIQNARAVLALRNEFGSLDAYVWRFVDGQPIVNRRRTMREVPARTAISDRLSKDLLKRGFKFVGSTICYAYMQATGMVNDHLVTCFRHEELSGAKP